MAFDDTKQDGDIVEPVEWNNMVADLKRRLGQVFNVQSFDASPDGTTTTTGSITAATPDLVVASNSTFVVDQGIVVVGAKLDTTDTGNTEDTDNDFTTTGGAADGERYARKFTATNSGAVGTVANVRLKKTGAPAGTIALAIYSDSSGPSAQIGGLSATKNNTALNASGAEETFTWATDWPVLTTGVDYWYVLVTVGYTYNNGVTEVIWETDADGAAGLNECYKWDSNAGTPWTTMGANVGANITVNYNLSTTITVISGTAVTLAANATATVSGAVVRHDEVVAIGAAHTAATVDGGWVFFPAGVYNIGADLSFNADSPLWFDPAATLAINSGVTASFFNMIPPTHTVFSGSGSMAFREQAITAAGDTILADAKTIVLNPDADYVMTSTPTIANGTPGQRVRLRLPNTEANSVTLQDQDTLGSSNLQLLASTRTISAKTLMDLEFDGTNWVELGSLQFDSLTIQETTPELLLHNTTEEDADNGRESSIRWKGEQSGGELTTLGMIRMSHDGAADDEKGQLEILINDTNDADSPTLVQTIHANGSLQHGDGGTTNYAQIAVDGTITLAGTARVTKHLHFEGATFAFGGTAPDSNIVGNYLTWAYDIGDDSAISFDLPDDWATGTDMTIKIDWGINRDEATENAEIQWNAIWSAVPHDASEVLTGAGTTLDPGDLSIPTNANTLTRTTLGTIAGASMAADDEMGIKITRVAIDDGNDPGAAIDPYITHLHIEYVSDKLGEDL